VTSKFIENAYRVSRSTAKRDMVAIESSLPVLASRNSEGLTVLKLMKS
jgi:hypothetical protein